MRSLIVFVCCALLATGCTVAKVNVDIVSERTAMENQVLGSLNQLDRDLLASASVRGVDPSGRFRAQPKVSNDARDATEAMRVLEFNADDVRSFKQLGWVGEDSAGLLRVFPMAKDNVPESLKSFADRFTSAEFDAVVDQVNEARMKVMRRVIDLNDSLNPKDLPAVQAVFGKLNREAALPGEKVELPDGSWTVRK